MGLWYKIQEHHEFDVRANELVREWRIIESNYNLDNLQRALSWASKNLFNKGGLKGDGAFIPNRDAFFIHTMDLVILWLYQDTIPCVFYA
jgi:hypothetical protein